MLLINGWSFSLQREFTTKIVALLGLERHAWALVLKMPVKQIFYLAINMYNKFNSEYLLCIPPKILTFLCKGLIIYSVTRKLNQKPSFMIHKYLSTLASAQCSYPGFPTLLLIYTAQQCSPPFTSSHCRPLVWIFFSPIVCLASSSSSYWLKDIFLTNFPNSPPFSQRHFIDSYFSITQPRAPPLYNYY